jgi:hypothetical protein
VEKLEYERPASYVDTHWRRSGQIAKQEMFNEEGKQIWKGTYRRGKLHGKVYKRKANETVKSKYVNGVNVTTQTQPTIDSTENGKKSRRLFSGKDKPSGTQSYNELKQEKNDLETGKANHTPDDINVNLDKTIFKKEKKYKRKKTDKLKEDMGKKSGD